MSKGVALVTGASRGIGRAVSLKLAEDGFDIAINDIPRGADALQNLQQEISKKGRSVVICLADVSVEAEVIEMISKVVDKLGGVDVMVANAGICIIKPFLETSIEDWDKIFSINARGVFLCYKYAAQQMIKQGRGGRLIGASSVAGKQGKNHLSAYSATKFAVRGLTQSAAVELGKFGITVNAYSPGAIDTQMLQEISESIGFSAWENMTSVKRTGTPDDVANVVSHLASKEASFITGQSISINGGTFFD